MISFVKTEGAAVAGSALCGADLYYLPGAFIYLTPIVILAIRASWSRRLGGGYDVSNGRW
ncbi:Hypothetical protein NGAL_HAMBI1145_52140 [Neorhizobium galegae bv. officinalis]|uniref:Uncharacterized protein n=1 Tax=Neorhizobium galegae bv. officinalis TaxID=323656 RepID=A0A0T7FYM2_NEOGA|nr:Hypothetical protein NGAL_HAMBI1145_52140 [Neorhizobium galegae bv. officinalis]